MKKKKKKRDLIDDPWHYVVENFEGILVRRGSDHRGEIIDLETD